MTVQIDAVDCEMKFANLPLAVEYSDSRGSITSEFASISLNQNGCDSESIKEYHHLNRPYFNVTDSELDIVLQVGESWIFKIPTPQHEDEQTDGHTYTIKVST